MNLTIHVSANRNGTSWINRLRHPKGRAALAARGFSFALLGMLFFWILSFVFEIIGFRNAAFFIFTISTTWALVIFIITLINHTSQRSGLLVKLIGLILITSFTGITAAAWISAPVSTANFQAAYAIPNRQTLHFEQNNATFSISQVDFKFDADLGHKLIYLDGENFSPVKLLTSFAYAGKNWEEIQVSPSGFIVFSQNTPSQARLKTETASIAAFYVQDMVTNENGGVFAHATEENTVITWYSSPRENDPTASITSQLFLYPDGSFDITYNGIHTNFNYNPYDIRNFKQVTGFFMGENDPKPTRIQFNNQLPYNSEAWNGVYQDYYVDFREYLHQNMYIQLYALLFTILVLIIVMPIFFQRSFVRPLKTLKQGFAQALQGDYDTWLEPNYNDDIGRTTIEFNQLLDFLSKEKNQNIQIIHELKSKLIQRNAELEQSVEKLSAEINARKSIQANLEACQQKNTQLITQDDMIGCYNRAFLLTLTEEEAKRAKRYNNPLSFAVIDPDYLRMINETYGTLTGDELLRSLAKALQETLRETDSLGRIGGEEFAVLMPETNGQEALQAANRWRNRIGGIMLETSKGPLRVSISVGVVEMASEGITSVDMLLHQANQALDAAKNQGRNSAVLWSPDLDKGA
jgi:diguanylate cyclase (GGDEF)-like protein